MDRHLTGTGRASLRSLPQVQKLLEAPGVQAMIQHHGRSAVVRAIRAELSAHRSALASGREMEFDQDLFLGRIEAGLAHTERPRIRRVINATGIVLHTNLGRAPLPAAAVAAVAALAGGYSSLEYALDSGGRGKRLQDVETLLREVTGAEAALAVNNNAAGLLLTLSALAAEGEVIVSRGELVEIGGSFRIPDIIRQGGAQLVEVGTTNRTRIADIAAAIGPRTRLILTVHASNYRIVGFTEAPTRAELSSLARTHGIPVVEDLGSGALLPLPLPLPGGLPHEPTVSGSLAAGMDLVCFSGDKLLGGPQAGLIAGRRDLVERLGTHPLMRALRLDKLAIAALSATLRLYRDPERASREIPVQRMLAIPVSVLARRADALALHLATIPRLRVEVVDSDAMAGGGSLPEEALPSRALALTPVHLPVEELAHRLRGLDLPVIGRLSRGRLLLDLRTVAEAEEMDLVHAVTAAMAERVA